MPAKIATRGIRYKPTVCPKCGTVYDWNRQHPHCPHKPIGAER